MPPVTTPKGAKPSLFEAFVIAVVDEYLRGPRIRSSHRVGDKSAVVALHDGIVLDNGFIPRAEKPAGIGVQSELRHESGQDPEKSDAIVK